MDEYAVFSLFLRDEEMQARTWIKKVSRSRLSDSFPPGLICAKNLRDASIKWRWDIRKNDYINQILEYARKEEEEKMESIGEMLHDLSKKIAYACKYSVENAIARGDEIPLEKIMDFIVKLADLQILKEDLEERRQHRISADTVPTKKIKDLLETIRESRKLKDEN